MLAVVLSYGAAIVVFVVFNFVATTVLAPIGVKLLQSPRGLPLARFVVDAACTFAAVFVVNWLAGATPLRPSYAAMLLPAFLQCKNAWGRVEAARAGRSGLRFLLERSGELHRYDQELDVRTEQASVFGMTAGYLAGLAIFFSGRPFF